MAWIRRTSATSGSSPAKYTTRPAHADRARLDHHRQRCMAIAASSAQKLFPVAPGATNAPTVPARKPGQIKSEWAVRSRTQPANQSPQLRPHSGTRGRAGKLARINPRLHLGQIPHNLAAAYCNTLRELPLLFKVINRALAQRIIASSCFLLIKILLVFCDSFPQEIPLPSSSEAQVLPHDSGIFQQNKAVFSIISKAYCPLIPRFADSPGGIKC